MPSFICTTCGVAYAESEVPYPTCLLCSEERQYVNPNGQSWTTLEALRADHVNDLRDLEPGLLGIGATPQIGRGQRALLISRPDGGVLWECTPLITDAALDAITARGGVRAMAISHPHACATMIDWSRALGGVPVYLHEDNRDWVMRPDPCIKFWSGDSHPLPEGITLVRTGGHFSGSTVLHWAAGAEGRGALLTADSIMVVPDTRWVSFMHSYPNFIPLNRKTVEGIVKSVRAYPFDRIYSLWWDRVMDRDGKAALQRSAERYIAAIR